MIDPKNEARAIAQVRQLVHADMKTYALSKLANGFPVSRQRVIVTVKFRDGSNIRRGDGIGKPAWPVQKRWPMIVTRTCLKSDVQAAMRVSEAAFMSVRQVYRPTPDAVRNKKKLEGDLKRLVALDGPNVVGTVQYHLEGDRLHLLGLAVSPSRWREGIARALMESLRKIASDHQCRRLSLFTIEQTGNVKVFERLGFKVVKCAPAEDVIGISGESLTDAYMESVLPTAT